MIKGAGYLIIGSLLVVSNVQAQQLPDTLTCSPSIRIEPLAQETPLPQKNNIFKRFNKT